MIQFKRGNAEDFKTKNPVLAAGQPGFEKDTGKLKIGNGQSAWNSLKYINDEKALLEKLYPIGSIQIMSTNTNPGELLGGTWELIDKCFKGDFYNYIEVPGFSSYYSCFDHIVSSHNKIVRTDYFSTDLSQPTELFKCNLETFGIAETGSGIIVTDYIPASSDGVITVVTFNLANGIIAACDIIPENASKENLFNEIYCNFNISIGSRAMLDSACDKFYFKRIA